MTTDAETQRILERISPGTVVEVELSGTRPFFAMYVYHDGEIVAFRKPVSSFLNLFRTMMIDNHTTFTFDIEDVKLAYEKS